MSERERGKLVGYFADLPDPRVVGRTDHDLLDIVIMALCAVMSGAEGWDDMEAWGQEREDWLRQFLRLRNGIPGHDTIRRVFEALSPAELEGRFERWVSAVCPAVAGRVIAIDGKALRGSGSVVRGQRALHLVSAYAAEYGLTLGQRACAEKSNEIMGCQTAIAGQIVAAKGDYVLAVKDNQPHLAEALRDFFATLNHPGYPQRTVSTFETLDKGHGRLETRRCIAVDELDWLDTMGLCSRWPGLASVACIEAQRAIGETVETETRYVISSLPADASRILHAVRTHWGIENGLHWCLDVTFGEDASTVRLRNAAHNFSFLRRLALNLFRADTSRNISLPRKRKTAAWNTNYLAHVLGLSAI
jgi:predicted transposase YbfD/YdcC